MSANSSPDPDHYETVVRDFKCGQVTPVLGAGANLTGRAVDLTWEPLKEHLPSGGELAEYLARHFHYEGDTSDLVRVSQYVAVKDGTGPLYEALHKIFDHNYDVTPLHAFLADLTASLRAKGQLERPPLLLTTNYDDLLERAFDSAGEKYDLVVYVAQGKDEGKFLHRPPGEKPRLIEQPDSYLELDPKKQTVILKIHGFVDRTPDPEDAVDSYVITEDHYIDYLSRTDLEKLLPDQAAHAAGEVPLPLPRLQPARLEPPGDPPPDLGQQAYGLPLVGRADPSRPARREIVETTRGRDLRHGARRVRRRAEEAPRGRGRRRMSTATVEAPAAVASPFKGLSPYTEEDAASFFGRDEEIEVVIANLEARRLTLVYGESGVGKSSLLRAGVVHRLRETARQKHGADRHP